jgi:hypothetical protein
VYQKEANMRKLLIFIALFTAAYFGLNWLQERLVTHECYNCAPGGR